MQLVITEQKQPRIPFDPSKHVVSMLCIQVRAPEVKKLLKELKRSLEFPSDLSHIKRIRRVDLKQSKGKIESKGSQILEVLLCKQYVDDSVGEASYFKKTTDSTKSAPTETQLPSNVQGTLEEIEASSVYIVKVPSQKPQSRTEFESGKTVWPMTYHQGPDLDDVEVQSHEFACRATNYMKHVLKLKAMAQEKGLGSADADQAAIFVDPAMNAIVAQSFFNNEPYPYRYPGHPLDNPVMRCIRQVAFRDVSSKELRNQYVEKFLKKDHRGNAEESGGKKKRKWGRDAAIDSNIPSKEPKYTKQFTTLSSYLCTGYDAFLAHEPNAFTAMAMLHSRVGRVFYMDDDPKCGVLGNGKSVQLHTLKGINHRYRVYKCKFDKVNKTKS